jgi:hypothetical protein
MAERSALALLGYDDDDMSAMGDMGFAGFPTPTGGFQPVGGFFGTALKGIASLGKGLIKKIAGGGSSAVSKAAKAAKRAALSPTGRAVIAAGAGSAIGSAVVPSGGGGLLPMPGGAPQMMASAMRAPSIIYDANGNAWRRAGRPVLWSGDLTAVRRVNKAAGRARRAAGTRRSVRRR